MSIFDFCFAVRIQSYFGFVYGLAKNLGHPLRKKRQILFFPFFENNSKFALKKSRTRPIEVKNQGQNRPGNVLKNPKIGMGGGIRANGAWEALEKIVRYSLRLN